MRESDVRALRFYEVKGFGQTACMRVQHVGLQPRYATDDALVVTASVSNDGVESWRDGSGAATLDFEVYE